MLYFQPPAGTWPPPERSEGLAGAYVSAATHLVVLQPGAEYGAFVPPYAQGCDLS